MDFAVTAKWHSQSWLCSANQARILSAHIHLEHIPLIEEPLWILASP
jgi:hypothetical protein